MNRKETISILALLRAAFPAFYRDLPRQDLEAIVGLWLDLFAEDDPRQVAGAVKALIATKANAYPPAIGEVKAKLRQLQQPEEMTELEAWSWVRAALKNSLYHAQEEFDRLPPVVQQVVCAPEQLRDWATMDEKTVQSVVSSNFQRSYQAKARQAKDFAALPKDLQALSAQLSQSMALPTQAASPPPALPPKVRTKEDIQRDFEALKQALAQAAGPRKAPSVLDTITDQEWAQRREEARRKLLEAAP